MRAFSACTPSRPGSAAPTGLPSTCFTSPELLDQEAAGGGRRGERTRTPGRGCGGARQACGAGWGHTVVYLPSWQRAGKVSWCALRTFSMSSPTSGVSV